jgi:hypothetical protein
MSDELFVHSLVLFGIVFGTALVLGLGVRLFLFRILGRYAERTETKIDDIVLKAARGPSYIWCVLLSLVAINFKRWSCQYNVLFSWSGGSHHPITTASSASPGMTRHYTEEVSACRSPPWGRTSRLSSALLIILSVTSITPS